MITKILGLFLLLAAGTVSAQTNHSPYCCRYPVRSLGEGKFVNLDPLFQWWIGHGGQNVSQSETSADYFPDPSRPMTAWKRITGIKTSELDYGWVVNAIVSTSPTSWTNEWIILRHPPSVEEYRYYNLQTLLAQYSQQITNDIRLNAADLKAAEKASTRANRYTTTYSRTYWADQAATYQQKAEQYRKAAADALADQKQTEAARDQAELMFKPLPGVKGRYVLDCFALELGRNSKGQLIFDVGGAQGLSQ